MPHCAVWASTLWQGESGTYELDFAVPRLISDSSDRTSEWLESLELERWNAEFLFGEHTVTGEDIIRAGCTETEGTAYRIAAVECLCRLFKEILENAPEGCPYRCKEVRVRACEYFGERSGTSWITCGIYFAVRPYDVCAFYEYSDVSSEFICDESDPDYGWMWFGGQCVLRRNDEGNWTENQYWLGAS